MSKIIDGHIHVTQELLSHLRGVRCIANADCPEEYRALKDAALPGMTVSAGIHPWKADRTPWEEMRPVLEQAEVIGEIGLDSVWCSVDLDRQRQVLRRQLDLAARKGKPVILHTKGMEREILETIRLYPNRYLVHWYACENWLEEYIDLGCWFTVGPDVEKEPVVARLAKTVPADRLLLESDGVEGIAWGRDLPLGPEDYREAMERHLAAVAALRGCSPGELAQQTEENMDAFLRGCLV